MEVNYYEPTMGYISGRGADLQNFVECKIHIVWTRVVNGIINIMITGISSSSLHYLIRIKLVIIFVLYTYIIYCYAMFILIAVFYFIASPNIDVFNA